MSHYRNIIATMTTALVLAVSCSQSTVLADPLQPPPPPQIAPAAMIIYTNRPIAIHKHRIAKPHRPPELKWLGKIAIVAEAADGYIVFVNNATEINPTSTTWPEEKVAFLVTFYDRAVRNGYAGRKGFADVEQWAAAYKISKANPILVVYDEEHAQGAQPTVTWYGTIPVITYGKIIRTQITAHGIQLATHELAHIWDEVYDWELGAGIATVVQNPDNYPTAKAHNEGAHEDFAESVTAYLWPGYAANVRWADDDPRFYEHYGELPDEVWTLDRYDYIARLFQGETVDTIRALEKPPAPTTGDEEKHSIFTDTPDIPITPQ